MTSRLCSTVHQPLPTSACARHHWHPADSDSTKSCTGALWLSSGILSWHVQELELALMQHSKSDPGNEMAEALELSQINKSASLGNAPGFKRPPISPVRGSSSRKNLTADSASPPRDALLQAPSSSLPPLQDSAAAKSAAAPGGHHGSAAAEPFPERFDTSLPFQSRVSAAVKYLASQPVKPRKHAAASAGHMQPWPAATLVRQQLSQAGPSSLQAASFLLL